MNKERPLIESPVHPHPFFGTTSLLERSVKRFLTKLFLKSIVLWQLCIPRKGIAHPQSPFPHTCVCERFKHAQDRSTYFPAADLSWEYIKRSQTHDCGNWDWGRAVPFLGIIVLTLNWVNRNVMLPFFLFHLWMRGEVEGGGGVGGRPGGGS